MSSDLSLAQEGLLGAAFGEASQARAAQSGESRLVSFVVEVLALAAAWFAALYATAYMTYNSEAMGRMVDVVDGLQQQGVVPFSGMQVALANSGNVAAGLFRAAFFFGNETLPLAIATAFSSTGVGAQATVLADPAAAVRSMQVFVANSGPDVGVDAVVCQGLRLTTPACGSGLCKDPTSKGYQILQGGLNLGLAGGMGGAAVAKGLLSEAAGPYGAVIGMGVGILGGALMASAQNGCMSSKCPCA